MGNDKTWDVSATEAKAELLRVQENLRICAEILGDIVEIETGHRKALSGQGVNLGPLHGLPVVIKDIIDVAGYPTRAGSDFRTNAPAAKQDAHVVARLRAAGAITVAKTNTVEFAFGGWGTNASHGTPRNPWKPDVSFVPGGSSSGTGAAVGGRFVPAGLGTDTGGSVRIPAAFCGCVGLKTSTGLVGRSGVVPLSGTFDTVGPLTDTVRRAAEILQVIMGEDRNDPGTFGEKSVDPMQNLDRGIAGLRLGVIAAEALEDAIPQVISAFHTACEILTSAGAHLVPVSLPKGFLTYQRLSTAILSAEAYAFHGDMVNANGAPINDTTRARMLASRDLSAQDRIVAQQNRRIDIAEFLQSIDRLDAIILPTSPTTAIPLADVNEDDYTVSLYTRLGNYLDLCGLSVPVGLTTDGLPTALQIIGRRFDDALVLRIGQAFENARGPLALPPVARDAL